MNQSIDTIHKINRSIYLFNKALSLLIITGFALIFGIIILGSLLNPGSYLFLLLVIPIAGAGFFIAGKLKKLRILARIREEWGKPTVSKKRNFEAARLLFDTEDRPGHIDDQTWHDLNMDKIYEVIDRTMTDPGEAVLYRMLRSPLFDKKEIAARNAILKRFQEDQPLREKIQSFLSRLGHQNYDNDLFVLLWGDILPSSRIQVIFVILALAGLFSPAVPFIWGSGVLAIVPITVFIINLLVHYISRRRYKDQLYSFPYLINLIKTAGKLSDIGEKELSPSISRLKTAYKSARKILNKTRFLFPGNDGPSATPVEIMFEYLNIFFLLEVRSFYSAASEIERQREHLKELYLSIGELDAFQSIASYRESLSEYTEPEFNDNGTQLQITDARYPLLKDPVPASITFDRKGMILTGSNMSGKSTFLRNIGCNVLLAQTIATSLASKYRGNLFRIITSISQTDDVISGKSYYYVEAERILNTINSLDKQVPTLCIIDELLSGTNSSERLRASDAIINYLVQQNVLVICATHDLELIEKLDGSCDLYHFTGTADETGLRFDYLLKPGPAITQNAIELLEYLGYPKEITERARQSDNQRLN